MKLLSRLSVQTLVPKILEQECSQVLDIVHGSSLAQTYKDGQNGNGATGKCQY
jgi:hypothetical protein